MNTIIKTLYIFIVSAIFLSSEGLLAQTSAWVSGEAGKAYVFQKDSLIEINFHGGTRQLMRNAVWQPLDTFSAMRFEDRQIRHPKPYVLSTPDTTLISFPGSGLVYGLNQKGQPIRLDETFYGGYNFDSFRALYKNRLYSVGGTGFWVKHGLVIYYDQDLKEWERITPFYGEPDGFSMGFGAQVDSTTFIICNQPDKTVEPGPDDYRIYKLNLSKREGESLGVFAMDDGNREHQLTPVGFIRNYAFFDVDGYLFVADLRNNKLYQWKDLTAGTGPFNGFEGVHIQKDTVNLMYSSSTLTNPSIRISRIAYEEILSYCEDTGLPAYRTTAVQLFLRYRTEFIVLILSLAFLIFFLIRYNIRQPVVEKQFVKLLSPSEVRLLRHLVLLPTGRSADIQEMDMLLEVEGKSWENQRKIRSKSLAHINAKAEELLGYRDLILRVPHPDDKRARLYHISPEYRSVATTLLRHL